MKKLLLNIVLIIFLSGCTKNDRIENPESCNFPPGINDNYSKKDILEKLLEQYTKQGLPGIVIAIHTQEGYWGTAKGFSKIENQRAMELCQLQYLQSISKTYLATAILKLYEEGKIDIDAPITNYLPTKFSRYIDKAETIKVRNLMNHTSGIPEYSAQPEYIAYLLQHPTHSFTTEEYLEYIKNKKLRFEPGSKFSYTNTNYHLLALIADAIEGDHSSLIRQKVLNPSGLTQTFYRNDPGYLEYPSLPNTYFDRYSNGIIENISMMQKANVASAKGDDGIVATPIDAINFLKSLMEGKLLSAASMQQMSTFVNDEDNLPAYGLGLSQERFFDQIGYGHEGSGIGAGSGLYYFPEKDLYVFVGTNIGTVLDGPITRKVDELKNKIMEILLN